MQTLANTQLRAVCHGGWGGGGHVAPGNLVRGEIGLLRPEVEMNLGSRTPFRGLCPARPVC
eukprot:2854490-Rhodomonas_salina.1